MMPADIKHYILDDIVWLLIMMLMPRSMKGLLKSMTRSRIDEIVSGATATSATCSRRTVVDSRLRPRIHRHVSHLPTTPPTCCKQTWTLTQFDKLVTVELSRHHCDMRLRLWCCPLVNHFEQICTLIRLAHA